MAINRLVSISEDGSLPPAAKVTEANLPDRLKTGTLDVTYAAYDGTVFNAKTRGVKGDGVTVDTAAINDVYTAARAAGRATVYFPPATYIIDGPINPNGVTTSGYGATLKIKPGVTQNFAAMRVTGAAVIQGLTIDLNKANTTNGGDVYTAMGVHVTSTSGWSDVTLREVAVKNGWQIGISLDTGSTATAPANLPNTPGLVTDCEVTNCRFGLWNLQTSNVRLIGNKFSNITEDAMLDSFTYRNLYTGNKISSTGGHGILVMYSSRTRVIGNDVDGCGWGGVTVGGGNTSRPGARDFIINGNTCTNNLQHGIWIDTTLEGAETTTVLCNGVISDNVCTGNTIHGMYLHNARVLTVTGNTAYGNGNSGILADSFRCAFTGNALTGNGVGLYLAGHVSGYGSHEIGRNVIAENTNNFMYDPMGAVNTVLELRGAGVPTIPAPVGSTYNRTDGGAGSSLYVKESGGTTSTGWIAK